jgi:hypothetical protein
MVLRHLVGDRVDVLLDVVGLLQGILVGLDVGQLDLLVQALDERLDLHGLLNGLRREPHPQRVHLLGVFHDVL